MNKVVVFLLLLYFILDKMQATAFSSYFIGDNINKKDFLKQKIIEFIFIWAVVAAQKNKVKFDYLFSFLKKRSVQQGVINLGIILKK